MTTLRGGCHCGGLRLELATARNPADLVPRACDCSFCRKHGAAYISDPAGRLVISHTQPELLREYQQGSNAARFLLCGRCGVLVAVVFRHEAGACGAVNIGCLEGDTGLAQPVPASPQALSEDQKISRWRELWVPDVVLAAAPLASPSMQPDADA